MISFPASVCFDVCRPNDLCPFFGLVGDELAEVGRSALILSMISVGVFLGAPRPYTELAS
jgi:hypothetical protein